MRLALVFGGRSGEHEVSVVSARSVARALDPARHEVVPMAIDRDGLWAEPDVARRVLDGSGDRADQVVPFRGRHRVDPRLLGEPFDCALPILHGPFGEDGTVQGLFEVLDLPYVGCDVAASAVCMDKVLTKRLLAEAGFATAPWVELDAPRWTAAPELVTAEVLELGLPVFVKPARLGSSVGISKVTDAGRLAAAVETALGHDRRVLVEAGLDAREIEVAVLGGDDPRASLPGEVVPGHEFYDYADKYLDDACQLLAPAPLSAVEREQAQRLAAAVFRRLGCAGMARVDLFLERGSGLFFVNEVNTIPGFTAISMYPKLWQVSGMTYPQLVEELVRLALERHASRPSRREG